MKSKTGNGRWSVTRLYRSAVRAHSSFPFRFLSSGRAFPAWHYFFEVTRRCNLRCKMCQYREWFDRNAAGELIKSELSTDEWKKLIDQTGRFSLLTFTGGEPWVRADFADILEYASRKRRTHVITNGLLLNEERVRQCVAWAPKSLRGKGLCFVGLSIDGPREIHDEVRGQEGAFDRTMGNLQALARDRAAARKRCPMLHVTAVIQESNVDRLRELPALCAEAGADVLNLTMEIRFPSLEQLGAVDPEALCAGLPPLPRIAPERLEACLSATQDAADKAGVELRLPDMPKREVMRYYDGGCDLRKFSCRGAWTNLYIGAQGDVFPCFIYRIGSIREQSLRALWNSPQMRAFRRRIRQEPFCICQGCCHLEYAGPNPAPVDAKESQGDH